MRINRWLVAGAIVAGMMVAGCGGEDDDRSRDRAAAPPARLAGVQDYLLEHTARLRRDVGALGSQAKRYHALAASVDFDYGRLLSEHGEEVRGLIEEAQGSFRKANPAYEEMEGVVAGVPELADFDVAIDAGGDSSDPENAVPFDVKTAAGKVFKQPGNYFYLVETSLFGTEPRFAARGVKPDLDDDGRVEFGEALPDAEFLLAATRDFADAAADLDASARRWKPTTKDALTALVVMTPTMSEYFEAWKSSRFVAGSRATEKAFVGASRLQDIADILGGLVVIYDNVQPEIKKADAQQAAQSATELRELHAFAEKLRDQEVRGRAFKPEEADALGSEAQDRAEAIAGQISQAAGRLGITLET